jgi:asparagine synthase (glutamine-hydrolysing)
MCGFFGILGAKNIERNDIFNSIDSIKHRGPDDLGIWIDNNDKISLSHARLSIQDLSPLGHQPMFSSDKRYAIVFNGEIYNFLSIKQKLEQEFNFTNWKSKSDTEVFLEAISFFGIRKTIDKLNGMFSFALWDSLNKTLTLGRDRMGEKPLYYGWLNNEFLFGSDLMSFNKYKNFNKEIDRDSLSLFMRYSYIPAPFSIYKNIYKLKPGHLLTVSLKNKNSEIYNYWDQSSVINDSINSTFFGDSDSVVSTFENLLNNSVKNKLIADVPIGAFLSGGIDSSLIVSIMQSQSSKPINTFTIGFDDIKYNEAIHAKAVAKHLGTIHNELYVTSTDLLDLVPDLCSIFSEPFADSSQLPSILVSKLAKKSVTVSLTGDGGDELFCGYRTYTNAAKLENLRNFIPYFLRSNIATLLKSDSTQYALGVIENIFKNVDLNKSHLIYPQKFLKLAELLESKSKDNLYKSLISRWNEPSLLVLNSKESDIILSNNNFSELNFIDFMMAIDTLMYLPDNNLCKVDRSSMSASLETRVPLLDHEIVKFACSLPLKYKLRNGVTKWPLRQVLYKHVPKDLIERPKMGFSVPLASWLRGPLREWADELLNESNLVKQGYLNSTIIRKKWDEHLSGKYNWQYEIWNVLIFQSWLQKNILS